MITEHFREVPSFRCMPWADPEGGTGGSDPPPLKNHRNIGFPSNIDPDPLKSQSYQASIQWWAIDTPAKHHFKGVSLMGRWWSILVAFRSSLTTPSDKMFCIGACMQCVWTGSIEIKLSTDIIYDILVLTTCDKGSDESAQVCILKLSIDGSDMSSITALCWMD